MKDIKIKYLKYELEMIYNDFWVNTKKFFHSISKGLLKEVLIDFLKESRKKINSLCDICFRKYFAAARRGKGRGNLRDRADVYYSEAVDSFRGHLNCFYLLCDIDSVAI